MRKFIPPLTTQHRFAWGLLCWLMLGLITYIDYAIENIIGLTNLSLIPIAIASWIGGRAFGMLITVAATAGWMLDHMTGFPVLTTWQYAWDATLKFGIWAFIVFLITELKKTLLTARHGFFSLLDTALLPLYVTDNAGKRIFTSRQLRTLFGEAGVLSAQTLEQRLVPHPSAATPPHHHFDVVECYDALSDRWYLRHTTPMPWVDGRDVRFCVLLDITSQKQAQELARQQEERLNAGARLMTLGGMASALAHELNQPLAAIVNYVQGSIRQLNTGNADLKTLRETMEKASRQAERAGEILRYARTLTQRRDPQFTPQDINGIVSDLSEIFQDSAQRHQIHFTLALSPSSLPVSADRIMLEQLLTNLVRNGIEAMHETPTHAPPRFPRELSISTMRRDDNAIELQVADTGNGLPPELAENLFSPFFTTKPGGLGLGLNLCRSIAEAHRGHLWATPNNERGTVFHLVLPAAHESIPAR